MQAPQRTSFNELMWSDQAILQAKTEVWVMTANSKGLPDKCCKSQKAIRPTQNRLLENGFRPMGSRFDGREYHNEDSCKYIKYMFLLLAIWQLWSWEKKNTFNTNSQTSVRPSGMWVKQCLDLFLAEKVKLNTQSGKMYLAQAVKFDWLLLSSMTETLITSKCSK